MASSNPTRILLRAWEPFEPVGPLGLADAIATASQRLGGWASCVRVHAYEPKSLDTVHTESWTICFPPLFSIERGARETVERGVRAGKKVVLSVEGVNQHEPHFDYEGRPLLVDEVTPGLSQQEPFRSRLAAADEEPAAAPARRQVPPMRRLPVWNPPRAVRAPAAVAEVTRALAPEPVGERTPDARAAHTPLPDAHAASTPGDRAAYTPLPDARAAYTPLPGDHADAPRPRVSPFKPDVAARVSPYKPLPDAARVSPYRPSELPTPDAALPNAAVSRNELAEQIRKRAAEAIEAVKNRIAQQTNLPPPALPRPMHGRAPTDPFVPKSPAAPYMGAALSHPAHNASRPAPAYCPPADGPRIVEIVDEESAKPKADEALEISRDTLEPEVTPKPDAVETKPEGAAADKPDVETPKPEATEAAKPEAAETPKPEATEAAKPEAAETPKPEATEAAKPEAAEAAKPEAAEAAKPEAAETPKPEAAEAAKPDAAEGASPGAAEAAKPDEVEAAKDKPKEETEVDKQPAKTPARYRWWS